LANMSHELRTPLNAISGFAEMMHEQVFGPLGQDTNARQKYGEYAEHITEASQHLLQVIGDVLDLAKIEAGRLDLRDSEVDLNELLQNCVALMRERALQKGLEIIKTIPDNLPPVRGDHTKLKQIFLNLLSNAVKFTPQDGRITVTVETPVNQDWKI